MLQRKTLLPLLLLLSGCLGPAVTGASRDTVVVRYNPIAHSQFDIQAKADAECARFDKKAIFVRSDTTEIGYAAFALFNCQDAVLK
jgi:hypothetical protein